VARPQNGIREKEAALVEMARNIIYAEQDSVKIRMHQIFVDSLGTLLANPGSFEYPFDSLTFMSKLLPEDRFFRLYTWELPLTGNSRRCFGFLQVPAGPGKVMIFRLHDQSSGMKEPESKVLQAGEWFGAVYFRIIRETLPDGRALYTLLGRNANYPQVTSKVIEPLTFNQDRKPVFGGPFFSYSPGIEYTRIIFRYSSTVSMVLRYEEQSLPSTKKWNPRQRRFETEETREKMIVCDRLVPIDPLMEGMYEYYVPASDVHDGFLFNRGKWVFTSGIDARNN